MYNLQGRVFINHPRAGHSFAKEFVWSSGAAPKFVWTRVGHFIYEGMLTLSSQFAHTSRARLEPQMAAYYGSSASNSQRHQKKLHNGRIYRSVSNAGQPSLALAPPGNEPRKRMSRHPLQRVSGLV